MTGTDCQACLAGEPTMGAPKGTKGQPSGACRNCSAFICEHHGQRDAGVPEFRCVQCDPKLLKASAVVIAQGTAGPDSATPQLRTAALGYQEYRTRPDAPAHWAIQSVEDFWARRSAYGPDLMHEFADTRLTTADGTDPESAATQGLLAGLPEEAFGYLPWLRLSTSSSNCVAILTWTSSLTASSGGPSDKRHRGRCLTPLAPSAQSLGPIRDAAHLSGVPGGTIIRPQ
jgi:hypothetical protein